MDWFLNDNGLCYERVKFVTIIWKEVTNNIVTKEHLWVAASAPSNFTESGFYLTNVFLKVFQNFQNNQNTFRLFRLTSQVKERVVIFKKIQSIIT